MNSLALIALAAAAAILIPGRARAQTPPTPAEIAAYRGLHAAPARGDAGDLNRLVQSGADLNARDGNGRTPAACRSLSVPAADRPGAPRRRGRPEPPGQPALRRRDDRRRAGRPRDGADPPRQRRERETRHEHL